MHLQWHVAAATVLAVMERNFIGPIVMGQVGIDIIDHGLWVVASIRPLTIKNIEKTMNGLYQKMEGQFYFFHTFEVWLGLMLWWCRWEWGRWFLMAYTIHLLMDIYWYLWRTRNWQWAKKWFLGWWLWKIYRNKKI